MVIDGTIRNSTSEYMKEDSTIRLVNEYGEVREDYGPRLLVISNRVSEARNRAEALKNAERKEKEARDEKRELAELKGTKPEKEADAVFYPEWADDIIMRIDQNLGWLNQAPLKAAEAKQIDYAAYNLLLLTDILSEGIRIGDSLHSYQMANPSHDGAEALTHQEERKRGILEQLNKTNLEIAGQLERIYTSNKDVQIGFREKHGFYAIDIILKTYEMTEYESSFNHANDLRARLVGIAAVEKSIMDAEIPSEFAFPRKVREKQAGIVPEEAGAPEAVEEPGATAAQPAKASAPRENPYENRARKAADNAFRTIERVEAVKSQIAGHEQKLQEIMKQHELGPSELGKIGIWQLEKEWKETRGKIAALEKRADNMASILIRRNAELGELEADDVVDLEKSDSIMAKKDGIVSWLAGRKAQAENAANLASRTDAVLEQIRNVRLDGVGADSELTPFLEKRAKADFLLAELGVKDGLKTSIKDDLAPKEAELRKPIADVKAQAKALVRELNGLKKDLYGLGPALPELSILGRLDEAGKDITKWNAKARVAPAEKAERLSGISNALIARIGKQQKLIEKEEAGLEELKARRSGLIALKDSPDANQKEIAGKLASIGKKEAAIARKMEKSEEKARVLFERLCNMHNGLSGLEGEFVQSGKGEGIGKNKQEIGRWLEGRDSARGECLRDVSSKAGLLAESIEIHMANFERAQPDLLPMRKEHKRQTKEERKQWLYLLKEELSNSSPGSDLPAIRKEIRELEPRVAMEQSERAMRLQVQELAQELERLDSPMLGTFKQAERGKLAEFIIENKKRFEGWLASKNGWSTANESAILGIVGGLNRGPQLHGLLGGMAKYGTDKDTGDGPIFTKPEAGVYAKKTRQKPEKPAPTDQERMEKLAKEADRELETLDKIYHGQERVHLMGKIENNLEAIGKEMYTIHARSYWRDELNRLRNLVQSLTVPDGDSRIAIQGKEEELNQALADMRYANQQDNLLWKPKDAVATKIKEILKNRPSDDVLALWFDASELERVIFSNVKTVSKNVESWNVVGYDEAVGNIEAAMGRLEGMHATATAAAVNLTEARERKRKVLAIPQRFDNEFIANEGKIFRTEAYLDNTILRVAWLIEGIDPNVAVRAKCIETPAEKSKDSAAKALEVIMGIDAFIKKKDMDVRSRFDGAKPLPDRKTAIGMFQKMR